MILVLREWHQVPDLLYDSASSLCMNANWRKAPAVSKNSEERQVEVT